MFSSKLCKSNRTSAWNLAFPVLISPSLWNMCESLHYESVYFKELLHDQKYYRPTIYRAGAAVVSTITSIREQDAIGAHTWASWYHAYVKIFFVSDTCECSNVVNC